MEELHVPYVVVCVVTLVAACLLHWVYRWMNPPCKGKLPLGSMGFPIVGETLQFFRPSPSLDIPPFYKLRLKRYGPVFKTSLVGQPVVISMDAELNRFIFKEEGKLFQSWYPESANSIFGKESISSNIGAPHHYVRDLGMRQFGTENLKTAFLDEMNSVVIDSLRAWATQPSIEVKESVSNMVFDLVAKKLISFDDVRARELRKNFDNFFQGLVAFPFYLPGTAFYRCIQGRKKAQNVLENLLKERLSTPEKRHGDLLDVVVDDLRNENPMADEKFIIDVIAALLFASYATISSTLTVGMKFLTDQPKVIEALIEEHDAILKKRETMNSLVTWNEYKSMTFTAQVTSEISRVGNAAPGIFRKSLKDVQVNGVMRIIALRRRKGDKSPDYTIPAGWLIMISPTHGGSSQSRIV